MSLPVFANQASSEKGLLFRVQKWVTSPESNLGYSLILSSLQTNTDTLANSEDPDEMAHIIKIYTVCHSVIDFFATMVVSKFRDGRVHVRNSGVEGLDLFAPKLNLHVLIRIAFSVISLTTDRIYFGDKIFIAVCSLSVCPWAIPKQAFPWLSILLG